MTKLVDQLVNGIVKSAIDEVLKKAGVKGTTRRTKRKTTTTKASGGLLDSIIDAALGKTPRAPRKTTRTATTTGKKQVSKRRTASKRSKQRTA